MDTYPDMSRMMLIFAGLINLIDIYQASSEYLLRNNLERKWEMHLIRQP